MSVLWQGIHVGFQAVRKHESAAHREQCNEQKEGKIKPSDAEVMAKTAEMEANKTSAYFLNDISKALGLTKDQIRYKREKPEYKEYHGLARESGETENYCLSLVVQGEGE